MKATRLPDNTQWSSSWELGCYSKVDNKYIFATLPNGEFCMIPYTGLNSWKLAENEDGTITISPSILMHAHESTRATIEGWHGFLERDIWRSC